MNVNREVRAWWIAILILYVILACVPFLAGWIR
jgi:hypothetical protein